MRQEYSEGPDSGTSCDSDATPSVLRPATKSRPCTPRRLQRIPTRCRSYQAFSESGFLLREEEAADSRDLFHRWNLASRCACIAPKWKRHPAAKIPGSSPTNSSHVAWPGVTALPVTGPTTQRQRNGILARRWIQAIVVASIRPPPTSRNEVRLQFMTDAEGARS